MIMKHPQNGSLKSITTLLLAGSGCWSALTLQGKFMKMQFGQLLRSSISSYQLSLLLSTAWNCFTILLQNPTGNR